MVLLDKSGSMLDPYDCIGVPTSASCPSRMSVIKGWGGELFSTLGQQARWGLTIYPLGGECGGATVADVLTQVPSTPGAGDTLAQLAAVAPNGGTPTTEALSFAGTFSGDTAERIIVLVTDGPPNCNANNPVDCHSPACVCTLNPSCNVDDSLCHQVCSDVDGAAEAVRSLASFGVFTLVVGVGPDAAAVSAQLDAMSSAATESTHCATDDDCFGAFTCMQGHCSGHALLAQMSAGLPHVTEVIKNLIAASTSCRYTLANDVEPGHLHASLDGEPVPDGDIFVESARRARLLGGTCKKLRADPSQPTFSVTEK
jgi:hypothetical protein